MGNTITEISSDDYGCYASEVRSKENEYNDNLNELESKLENNKTEEKQNLNEWEQRIQEKSDRYQQQQTDQTNKWNQRIHEASEKWDENIKSEEAKLQKEIEKKKAIIKEKQEEQEEMKEKPMECNQCAHQYKPSLSNGTYGDYVINSQQYRRRYKPSLSNGVYGSYVIKNKCHHNNKHVKNSSVIGPSLTITNDDEKKAPQSAYNKIYDEVKKMDDKYRLIFKPECNIKGCCNKPNVDSSLLKGDMYICKQHRIEMANKIKQSGIQCDMADEIIHKLSTMSDAELLKEGQEMEKDDYFLKNYTKLQIKKKQIVQKLSTLDGTHSEYWLLMIQYKQIQNACNFMVLIRKLCNPLLAIFAVVVVVVVVVAVVCVCIYLICRCKGSSTDIAREKYEQYQKEQQEKITKLNGLMDNLYTQLTDTQTQKSKCEQLMKDEETKYKNKLTNLENEKKQKKWTEEMDNEWTQKITDEKNKQKQEEQDEEKKWTEKWTEKENETNTAWDRKKKDEENKFDGWIRKNVKFQEAIDEINQKMDDAAEKVKNATEAADQLQQQLNEAMKTFDIKQMKEIQTQMKELEDVKKDNLDKMKDLKDDLKEKEEKKPKDDDMPPVTDIAELEKLKKWKLAELEKSRKDELKLLNDQRNDALDSLKNTHTEAIAQMETDKDNAKKKLEAEREKINQQISTHKTTTKRQLEKFKTKKKKEVRQLKIDEDNKQFERAKTKAEILARETSDGRVALYVVYDGRKSFSTSYSASDTSRDESYLSYGNWKICKFEANSIVFKDTWWKISYPSFSFTTSGRTTCWIHYNDSYDKDENGDTTTYTLK